MTMDRGRKTRCARKIAKQATWRIARQTAWVVEPHGVALIRLADGRRCELSYPEAAVWDLTTRCRPEEAVCSMLELIAGIGPREAETLVNSCLAKWLADGWLEKNPLATGAPE